MSTVYAYPPPGITAPAIVVGYPVEIELASTFGRGSDSVVIPVWFAVADQGVLATARDAVSAVLGSGTTIANTLSMEAAWGATHCGKASIDPLRVGGVDYLAVRFDVNVATSGALDLSAVMDGIAGACSAAGL